MMTKIFKLKSCVVICLILCLGIGDAIAQDIHFSQFYASPLTLNPALTGKHNGSYRIAGIYRNQWWSLTNFGESPYQTPAISFDMPFFVGKNKKDAIGVGLSFFNDIQHGGGFNYLQVNASVAYHKSLDKASKHQLSLGIQGGYTQFKTDLSKQIFGSEITTGIGETLANETVTYPNFNVGLFYNGAITTNTTFYVGGSFFNLFKPEEDFTGFAPDDSRRPIRQAVHTGFDIKVTDRISLLPGLLYMNQSKAQEINVGLNVGFALGSDSTKTTPTTLYIGGWYRNSRNSDAAIAMAAIEFNQFRFGVSYDFNVSDLNQAQDQLNSALEISIIYIGKFIVPEDKVMLFCPRY